MRIALIVAVADNGVIGRAGQLPWRLSSDLKRFKRLTMGSPIIMGRTTHQSIGKALPGRRNIVLSRRTDLVAEGCAVVTDVETALAAAREGDPEEVFVIGGAAVYRAFLDRADRVYLTRVHAAVEGDTFLPELGEGWRELSREELPAGERDEHPTSFVVLERVG